MWEMTALNADCPAKRLSSIYPGVRIMGPEAAAGTRGSRSRSLPKLTAGDAALSVHAHPTLCECFRDACLRVLEKEK